MDSKYIFDYVYMSDGIFAAIFLMKLAFNYAPSNATNKKKNNHQYNNWVYWLKLEMLSMLAWRYKIAQRQKVTKKQLFFKSIVP